MKVSFSYNSDNSTEALNNITRGILPKGVYLFPGSDQSPIVNSWVNQRPSTYYIDIQPGWVVRSMDGMTIREDSTTYSVIADLEGIYYVGLTAQYLISGEPRLEIKCIAKGLFDGWVQSEKDAFIIFSEINVTNTQDIISNIESRTMPRGIFALDNGSGSGGNGATLLSVADFTDLTTQSPANSIAYIESEGRLAVFEGGANWLRVKSRADYQLTGSATFSTHSATHPQPGGTTVSLPDAGSDTIVANAYSNNLYQVIITPTSDSTSVGSFWVIKQGQSFTVRSSGNAAANSTFDWMVVLQEQI